MCGAFLVVTLALVLPATLDGQHPPPGSVTPVTPQPSLTSVARTEQAIATEQWWIVSTVLRALQDLASSGQAPAVNQMLAMARDERPTTSAQAWTTQYTAIVSGRRLRATVDLTSYVWDPGSYAAVAAELIGGAASDVSVPSILPALQDATPRALHETNVQVSATLGEHARSATVHQQAALLLGAFALRESSALFTDQRAVLCRLTAHLAMARALGGPAFSATLDGRVAEIILLALAGRQADALAALESATPQLVAQKQDAWVKALRLRITGDWRTPDPAAAPLLERLEYYRAVRERTTVARALTLLDGLQTGDLAEWGRITAMSRVDVEGGQRFVPDALTRELTEAADAWHRFHVADPSPAQLVADLNAPLAPGPFAGRIGPRIAVIDWSLWAAFHQRNICAWLVVGADHFSNLGLPDDEKAWNAHADEKFPALRLYPLVLRFRARNRQQYDAAVAQSRPLMMQSPELITDAAWRRLVNGRPFDAPIADLPAEKAWFVPAMPVGTTYELNARAWGLDGQWTLRREDVAALRAMSPYSAELVWESLCQKYGEPVPRAPAAIVLKEYAAISGYDASAMHSIMTILDQHPEDYLPVAEQLCGIEAGQCERLGDYLLDLGRDAEAATAFDHMVTGARDRVGVSNSVSWLVRYDHDTGRKDRALEIAKMAADTRSAGGLTTLGDELDRLGRFDEAEETYKAIEARYGDSDPLLSFYLRQARRAGRPLESKRTLPLIAAAFGEKSLMTTDGMSTDPPVDGVKISSTGLSARRAGMQLDDVIVGFDGLRVHNCRQYQIVKRIREADQIRLLVWRGGRYLLIPATVPRRAWQLSVQDYKP